MIGNDTKDREQQNSNVPNGEIGLTSGGVGVFLSFRLDKYKKMLEQFLDDLVTGKETPLTSEAKSQGQKVVSEAKNKAERLLEDVDELLAQMRGDKKS